MSTMSSRPGGAGSGTRVLLVLDLWVNFPGVSELRISKYDDTGTPRFACAMTGEYHVVMAAADVAKAAYIAAGVRYNLKEVVH